jgi:hypothetical protein
MGSKTSKGQTWEHTSGWKVVHCGHPTANWPYYLGAPADHELDGDTIVSFNGLGFRFLDVAQTVAELVHNGAAVVTRDRCVGGVARVLLQANGEPTP